MNAPKRLIALLLSAACLCALVAAAPASAASAVSTFTDITDPAVGEAVEVLRTMGLIDGIGNGRYLPNGHLTRAQFCKLSITVMGEENLVSDYTSRTIFTDVASTHWARGYINLAASELKGVRDRLITGKGDGTFAPDDPISYAEAVTLLLRVLGYTREANSSWPRGAMTAAEKLGLTKDMPALDARAAISRGAGAILFRNLLTVCPSGSASPYVSALGKVEEDVILLSCNTTTADGRTGAVLLFSGKTGASKDGAVLAAVRTPPDFFQGLRGTAVFDKDDGRFLTFLPDRSASSRTLVTAKAATGSTCVITGVDGSSLTVTPSTTVWYQGEKKDYREIYTSLNRVGVTVTAYFTTAGAVEFLYVGGASQSSASASAAVVRDVGLGDPFAALTGGASGYTILKNGAAAQLSHISQYDVATYDAASNTLFVTDFRLTGIYQSASPSAALPNTLKFLDKDFDVLDCAVDDLKQFKLGSSVTLLFTADGKVAGAEDPSKVRSNAVGMVTDSSSGSDVTVELVGAPTGKLETITGTISGDAASYRTGLVSVTGLANNSLRLTRLTSKSTGSSLNVSARTLGDAPLAENVQVFERIGSGGIYATSLPAVTTKTVPASKILYQRLNYAGAVDLLVLSDVTGDGYTYGIAKNGEEPAGSFGDSEFFNRTTTVCNSENKGGVLTTVGGVSYRDGQFIGLAASLDKLDTLPRVAGSMALSSVTKAVRSDFDLSSMYFSRSGVTLPIYDKVQCYNASTKTWFDGKTVEERLNACLSYGDSFTVYYDRSASEGGKVRIIVAN